MSRLIALKHGNQFAAQGLLGKSECVLYRYIRNFWYLFVKMSFWSSAICQEETSESLEGVFPDGVINRGKNNS